MNTTNYQLVIKDRDYSKIQWVATLYAKSVLSHSKGLAEYLKEAYDITSDHAYQNHEWVRVCYFDTEADALAFILKLS